MPSICIRAALMVAAMLFAGTQTGFSQQALPWKTISDKNAPQKFHWGIQAGIVTAKLYDKTRNEYVRTPKPFIGCSAGTYFAYDVSQRFGLSIEPEFIQKGEIAENVRESRLRLDYINLPLLANYYASSKWSFSLGPAFGYLAGGNLKIGDQNIPIANIYDKKFEVSGIVGLTYAVSSNFDLSLRYSQGFTPVATIFYSDDTGNSMGFKEKNLYGQLLLRYRI